VDLTTEVGSLLRIKEGTSRLQVIMQTYKNAIRK
jgi:hypothetical protein